MNANPFFSCDHPQSAILSEWRDVPDMKLLNLVYDLTPIDFVTLVITVPHTFAHLRTFSHIFAHFRTQHKQSASSPSSSRCRFSLSLARREYFARSPGVFRSLAKRPWVRARGRVRDLAPAVFAALVVTVPPHTLSMRGPREAVCSAATVRDLAPAGFAALVVAAPRTRPMRGPREAVGAPAVCLQRTPSEKYSDRGVFFPSLWG